jgi:hypothetical protein
MHHIHARSRLECAPLDQAIIRKTVLKLFRRRNDYGTDDLTELVAQLAALGVINAKQLSAIMKKHRRLLREDEERRMAHTETRWLVTEMGWEGIDVHANKSWFSVAGLVRNAMELEFGKRASALWTYDEA